jgi:hypothetical protein
MSEAVIAVDVIVEGLVDAVDVTIPPTTPIALDLVVAGGPPGPPGPPGPQGPPGADGTTVAPEQLPWIADYTGNIRQAAAYRWGVEVASGWMQLSNEPVGGPPGTILFDSRSADMLTLTRPDGLSFRTVKNTPMTGGQIIGAWFFDGQTADGSGPSPNPWAWSASFMTIADGTWQPGLPGPAQFQFNTGNAGYGQFDGLMFSSGWAWWTSKLRLAGMGDNRYPPVTNERLDVQGGIKLETALADNEGTIQYSGGHFQGRQAGGWVPLDVALPPDPATTPFVADTPYGGWIQPAAAYQSHAFQVCGGQQQIIDKGNRDGYTPGALLCLMRDQDPPQGPLGVIEVRSAGGVGGWSILRRRGITMAPVDGATWASTGALAFEFHCGQGADWGNDGLVMNSVWAQFTPHLTLADTIAWYTGSPERLDVYGGVVIRAALADMEGTIQYANGRFQGRQAGGWVNFDEPIGVLNGGGVETIEALTQAAYDALSPKVATTLYVITA